MTEREAKDELRSSIISDLAYLYHREMQNLDDFPYRRADAFAAPVLLGTLALFQQAWRIGDFGDGQWPNDGVIRDGILVGHAVIRHGEFYVGRIVLDPGERALHGDAYAIRNDTGDGRPDLTRSSPEADKDRRGDIVESSGAETRQDGRSTKGIVLLLMTIALEDGVQTTAAAYGRKPKTERGESTCAGTGCGRKVYFVPAHFTPKNPPHVLHPDGFRLWPSDKGHVEGCNVWRKMGLSDPKERIRAERVDADGPFTHIRERCAPVNAAEYRLRWGDGSLPAVPTIARPNPTVLVEGPATVGHDAGDARSRPKRLRSAAEIEQARSGMPKYPDPRQAGRAIVILIGDDEKPVAWAEFFANWNAMQRPWDLADKIRDGQVNELAIAATVVRGAVKRPGGWFVECTRRRGKDGVLYTLWLIFSREEDAASVDPGGTYLVAGPDLEHDERKINGAKRRDIALRVPGPRWIAESAAPLTEQEARSLLSRATVTTQGVSGATA